MQGYHSSVLLKEAIDALMPNRPRQDGLVLADKNNWYLDCTLGDGGHTLEILKQGGRVVGIDADPEAINRTKKRLEDFGFLERAVLIQGNFRDINSLLKQTDITESKFVGAIFDLGVSSLQLMSPERGFSFGKLGPLDMRMDPSLQIQALDLVNNLSGKELYELFRNLGEEKYSRRLADVIVRAREVKPFTNTLELSEVIERAIGGKREKIHPATRAFQALRMVVNDELGALKEGLEEVKNLLGSNGRMVVISFHSLEDRIVKNTFKDWENAGIGEILIKKPFVPSNEEIADNPRSRSAKMRVFKKL